MTVPQLAAALRGSWPAAEARQVGGFSVALNGGLGGERVNAAYAGSDWAEGDIDAVISVQEQHGQRPLFSLADSDAPALEQALRGRGFQAHDPTAILLAPMAALTDLPLPPVTTFSIWPAMAIQRSIWQAGGIGPDRQAVMDRAAGPKTSLLGRIKDRAAGTGFVAISDGIAVLHAVYILPDWRRMGLAEWMIRAAAFWARDHGADQLALQVERANSAALDLYRKLGFAEMGGYRYFAP